MGQRGELFSSRASTPKRTYFFNIKENRTGDVFLNIVESKKRETPGGGEAASFERHSVIVFEDDVPQFMEAFDQALDFVRKRRGRR